MKMKLFVSLAAFCVTFIVSIYNNLLLTSVKRSLFAMVLFYVVALLVEKFLHREVEEFQNHHLPTDDNQQEESSSTSENQTSGEQGAPQQTETAASEEFQPLDYSKNAEMLSKGNVDEMDPKLLANLLNQFSDDNKNM